MAAGNLICKGFDGDTDIHMPGMTCDVRLLRRQPPFVLVDKCCLYSAKHVFKKY